MKGVTAVNRLFMLLAIVIGLSIQPIRAQVIEAGVFIGASNYMGDLAKSGIVLTETSPAIGALLRINPHPMVSLRVGANVLGISGNDENFTSDQVINNNLRNLSFQSRIIEFNVMAEVNLLGFLSKDKFLPRFTPYIFAGLAVFHFKPEGYYTPESRWVELQPLGTEGQLIAGYEDRKYELTQISIPTGLGIKVRVVRNFNLGLELGVRKTFTDYLDDVSTTYVDHDLILDAGGPIAAYMSDKTPEVAGFYNLAGDQRGQPNKDDWYVMGGINITYTFKSNGGSKRGSGCYSF